MNKFMKIFNIFKANSFNHVTRIKFRLEPSMKIIENFAPTYVKEKVNKYNKEINIIHTKTLIFFFISLFLYLALYVSLLSTLTKNMLLLEKAVGIISWIGNVLGSFIIIAIIFTINKINNANISEALVLSSYITAYAAKSDKRGSAMKNKT